MKEDVIYYMPPLQRFPTVPENGKITNLGLCHHYQRPFLRQVGLPSWLGGEELGRRLAARDLITASGVTVNLLEGITDHKLIYLGRQACPSNLPSSPGYIRIAHVPVP
jgi:hypothetical protein